MTLNVFSVAYFMKEALKEAVAAGNQDEVPVGAVVVCDNKIIARAHNLTERLNDVTAHAEMLAITAAANHLGGKYLENCTLYVTLEPCLMCAGALHHAHIGKIVWGADDPKKGFSRLEKPVLHPKTEVEKGVEAQQCEHLLKDFFARKRE
ncbi:MAG TPA: nucleoside deaminase [Bacteroidales bacterium]|nr:nucleoside deaminase [Bacteroidales bacterium]HQQ11598.1 nucleoside deaminase [Bacteroidales bacterium]